MAITARLAFLAALNLWLPDATNAQQPDTMPLFGLDRRLHAENTRTGDNGTLFISPGDRSGVWIGTALATGPLCTGGKATMTVKRGPAGTSVALPNLSIASGTLLVDDSVIANLDPSIAPGGSLTGKFSGAHFEGTAAAGICAWKLTLAPATKFDTPAPAFETSLSLRKIQKGETDEESLKQNRAFLYQLFQRREFRGYRVLTDSSILPHVKFIASWAGPSAAGQFVTESGEKGSSEGFLRGMVTGVQKQCPEPISQSNSPSINFLWSEKRQMISCISLSSFFYTSVFDFPDGTFLLISSSGRDPKAVAAADQLFYEALLPLVQRRAATP